MTYKESLEICENHGVSPQDASVANEVDFFFNGGKGRELSSFEQLCELTNEAYQKVDTLTSLSQVVDSLRDLIEKGLDINKIDRYDIIRNIKY